MRIMGHSTVVVSQKYLHPAPQAMERTFERLNSANEKALASLPEATQSRPTKCLPTTLSTTFVGAEMGGAKQVL